MKGTAPVTPVLLSSGVSTTPNGAVDAPAIVRSVTVMGPAVLDAPENASVTDPVTSPPIGRPLTNATATVSVAGPMPLAGLTVSHGWFEVAVQLTLAVPATESRTVSAAVCDVKAAPFEVAAKRSALRSIVTAAVAVTVVETVTVLLAELASAAFAVTVATIETIPALPAVTTKVSVAVAPAASVPT